MSGVQAGSPWIYDKYKFHGLSLSGIRTAIAMPELSLSFDVAQGYPFLLTLKKFFISHGHLDHAAGIPYIISQKAMTNQPCPDFYMPASLVEPMTEMMKIWEKIEGHQYKYNFHAIDESSQIEINQGHYIQPFKTVHRIDSFGYTLFEKTKKLKAELCNASREQIIDLKNKNVEIHSHNITPLVSFTGDTQIEFLDLHPEIKKSKILFLEATYLDDKKSVDHAKQWGHTHFSEIVNRMDQLECEKIVLIHISSRYSPHEIQKIVYDKLPHKYHNRVEVFPGR